MLLAPTISATRSAPTAVGSEKFILRPVFSPGPTVSGRVSVRRRAASAHMPVRAGMTEAMMAPSAKGQVDGVGRVLFDGREIAGEGVEEAENAGHGAVGCLGGICGNGPLGDESSINCQPDPRPRVPYVDRQNQRHNRSSFHLFRSCTFRQ